MELISNEQTEITIENLRNNGFITVEGEESFYKEIAKNILLAIHPDFNCEVFIAPCISVVVNLKSMEDVSNCIKIFTPKLEL